MSDKWLSWSSNTEAKRSATLWRPTFTFQIVRTNVSEVHWQSSITFSSFIPSVSMHFVSCSAWVCQKLELVYSSFFGIMLLLCLSTDLSQRAHLNKEMHGCLNVGSIAIDRETLLREKWCPEIAFGWSHVLSWGKMCKFLSGWIGDPYNLFPVLSQWEWFSEIILTSHFMLSHASSKPDDGL